MLPTFSSAGTYYAAPKRKGSREETPWTLLIILMLAGTCALVTRHRSLVTEVALVSQPRELLERYKHHHSEEEELAEHNFNAHLHSLYTDLPPLRSLTLNASHGGWQYTKPVYDYAAHHPAAEVLSFDRPRLIRFKSFLSPAEVGHMIDVASAHLERSEVLSADSTPNINEVRTSFGSWPPPDDVMDRVEERIHRLVGIPRSFGESIYVLNYKLNQRYDAHTDNCMDDLRHNRIADPACKEFLGRAGGPLCGPGHGGDSCGDRIATFILLLKAPKRGGRTVFPRAALTESRLKSAGKGHVSSADDDEWYCKHDEVLGSNASPGDALLFFDYRPDNGAGTGSYADGTADPVAKPVPESLHSGCPVEEGEKWIATRWIRSAEFV